MRPIFLNHRILSKLKTHETTSGIFFFVFLFNQHSCVFVHGGLANSISQSSKPHVETTSTPEQPHIESQVTTVEGEPDTDIDANAATALPNGTTHPRTFYLTTAIYFGQWLRFSPIPKSLRFANPYPVLTLGYRAKLPMSIEFSGSPFFQKSEDGGSRTRIFIFSTTIEKSLGNSDFSWCFGPAVKFIKISGSGGSSLQQNGITQRGFSLPSENVIITNIGIQSGLLGTFHSIQFKFAGLLTRLFSQKRSLDIYLGVGYVLF